MHQYDYKFECIGNGNIWKLTEYTYLEEKRINSRARIVWV